MPPGIGLAAWTESKSRGPEEFRLCDTTCEASNDRGGKRIAERARSHPKEQFNNLAHLILSGFA